MVCCTGTTGRTAQIARTAAAGRHLLLDVDQIISNLSSSSDLDTSSVTTPFGLEVYGNDQPTGLIADSGSTEVHTYALTCLPTGCRHLQSQPESGQTLFNLHVGRPSAFAKCALVMTVNVMSLLMLMISMPSESW